MHFSRNLLTAPTYYALISADKRSHGHPEGILLDDVQTDDAHTPQMGVLGIQGAGP